MSSTETRHAPHVPAPPSTIVLPDGRVIPDQRRPGRVAHADPALIPLLRHPDQAELPIDLAGTDPLAPARGIGFGVLAGGVLWALALVAARAVWPG